MFPFFSQQSQTRCDGNQSWTPPIEPDSSQSTRPVKATGHHKMRTAYSVAPSIRAANLESPYPDDLS